MQEERDEEAKQGHAVHKDIEAGSSCFDFPTCAHVSLLQFCRTPALHFVSDYPLPMFKEASQSASVNASFVQCVCDHVSSIDPRKLCDLPSVQVISQRQRMQQEDLVSWSLHRLGRHAVKHRASIQEQLALYSVLPRVVDLKQLQRRLGSAYPWNSDRSAAWRQAAAGAA